MLDKDQPNPRRNSESKPVWPALKETIRESCSEKNVEEILDYLEQRVMKGVEHYGTVLMSFNGRDSKMDALQEAADLMFYVKQLEIERESKADKEVCQKILKKTVDILCVLLSDL